MPSDIHKKLVFAALGCGGLLVVLAGIGVIAERSGLISQNEAAKSIPPRQSAASWDSLSAASVAGMLGEPPVQVSFRTPKARGVLIFRNRKGQESFPLLGDTFPAGSPERSAWALAAQRVVVRNLKPRAAEDSGALMMAPVMFFRGRVLLAAADNWSREGHLPEAALALDSALAVGLAYAHSDDLDRVWVGVRIERDAMDLLWRDTVLAGGPIASERARQAVAPLDRLVTNAHALDRWITAIGADPRYVDSLAGWVSDSALPLPVRTAAVRAIALGWVFSALEPGMGPVPARREALRRLRASHLPEALNAAIDRDLRSGTGLTQRFAAVGTYRAQRMLLLRP